jgi:hypothetical protein
LVQASEGGAVAAPTAPTRRQAETLKAEYDTNRLVVPICMVCACTESDPRWEHIFTGIAYGRFPAGVYLRNNVLCCNVRGRAFNVPLDQDPDVVAAQLKDRMSKQGFFRETTNGLAATPVAIANPEAAADTADTADAANDAVVAAPVDKKWTDVKKKAVREAIIVDYVMQCHREHKLSRSKASDLYTTINTFLVLRYLQPKDITYENGQIKTIALVTFPVPGTFEVALRDKDRADALPPREAPQLPSVPSSLDVTGMDRTCDLTKRFQRFMQQTAQLQVKEYGGSTSA